LSAMKHAIADIPLPPMPEKNIFRGLSCIIHAIVTQIVIILERLVCERTESRHDGELSVTEYENDLI